MSKVGLDDNKCIVGAVSFKYLGLCRVTVYYEVEVTGLLSNRRMHGGDSREFVLGLVFYIVMSIGIRVVIQMHKIFLTE